MHRYFVTDDPQSGVHVPLGLAWTLITIATVVVVMSRYSTLLGNSPTLEKESGR